MNSVFTKEDVFELCHELPFSLMRVSIKSYHLAKKFFGSLRIRCEKCNIPYPGDDFLQVASMLMYMLPGNAMTNEKLSTYYKSLDLSVPIDEFMTLMKKVSNFIIADRLTFVGMYSELEKTKDKEPILFILCTIDFAAKLKVYLDRTCDGIGYLFADSIDHFLE